MTQVWVEVFLWNFGAMTRWAISCQISLWWSFVFCTQPSLHVMPVFTSEVLSSWLEVSAPTALKVPNDESEMSAPEMSVSPPCPLSRPISLDLLDYWPLQRTNLTRRVLGTLQGDGGGQGVGCFKGPGVGAYLNVCSPVQSLVCHLRLSLLFRE